MTCEEFSDQFDVLYNNIMSNAAPGLNEYEKSVFLTKAQYEIVKNYFNPSGNKYKEGYDGSAKRQVDFSQLMQRASLTPIDGAVAYDGRATVYGFPSDVLVIVNEQVVLSANDTTKGVRQVVPIAYGEYMRLMSKPYKEPLKNQAWRLITGQADGSAHAELILNANDKKNYSYAYEIRYVR